MPNILGRLDVNQGPYWYCMLRSVMSLSDASHRRDLRPSWTSTWAGVDYARVGDSMKLVDGLRGPIITATNDTDSRGHQWGRTGVTLLLSRDSAVERCSSCHSYRIRGQVRWEDDDSGADACPGKPLHWWEV